MKVLIQCLLVAALASLGFSNVIVVDRLKEFTKPAVPAKTYTLDLDLPPIKRWDSIVKQFDADLIKTGLRQLITQYVPAGLIPLIDYIASDLERFIPQPYADEIKGISQSLNISLSDVVLINIMYDISAFNSSTLKACTSIVAVDKTGRLIQGRNLDYAEPSFLRQLTIQVDYHKGGKSLFMATTYVTYVGVITGSKHGAFSVTGDQRNKGRLLQNIVSAIKHSDSTFFLERMVLETATDYESALNMLIKIPTIAPVYYIVGGMNSKEGAIIVKNRENVLNVTRLGQNKDHPWYIVETNYDPWNKPPASDDRRDAAIKAMNQVGQKNLDVSTFYQVFSTQPVFNPTTTYTTIMSAADSSVYHTMIRYDAPPK